MSETYLNLTGHPRHGERVYEEDGVMYSLVDDEPIGLTSVLAELCVLTSVDPLPRTVTVELTEAELEDAVRVLESSSRSTLTGVCGKLRAALDAEHIARRSRV